jgi:hypothetical protein
LNIEIKSTDKEKYKRKRIIERELIKRDKEEKIIELIYQRLLILLRYFK